MKAKRITLDAVPHRYDRGYFWITPREAPSREQEMCNSGIFNLMGIRSQGVYVITCRKVGNKPRKGASE